MCKAALTLNRATFQADPKNRMYEWACEPYGTCNNDQYSFKAYLGRWLAKSAIVAPYISDTVHNLLNASSNAAAQACSGGADGQTCGQKWYVGGYDGSKGIGQQLSALETVQAVLLLQADTGGAQMYPSVQSTQAKADGSNTTTSTMLSGMVFGGAPTN